MATSLRRRAPRVDRFSNLPIEIAHLVLSHLTFKDLTRVSCVSKRCREFYISTPYLNFLDFSDVDLNSGDLRTRVLDSMDRFFVQRGVDRKIQCFRFRWGDTNGGGHGVSQLDDFEVYGGENLQPRLLRWVGNALKCNVEVLHLVVTFNYWFREFPASCFHSASLKSLLLDMNCVVDVPGSDFSSNLEYLRLLCFVKGQFLFLNMDMVECRGLNIDRLSEVARSFFYFPSHGGAHTGLWFILFWSRSFLTRDTCKVSVAKSCTFLLILYVYRDWHFFMLWWSSSLCFVLRASDTITSSHHVFLSLPPNYSVERTPELFPTTRCKFR